MHRQDRLLAALRDAVVADQAFDQHFPEDVRLASRRFWTPATVAQGIARLFRRFGAHRVLDVGAGAGKFCLVAAAAVEDVRFVGVEQRPRLVEIAHGIQQRLAIANAQFLVGDATCVAWTEFDGFYLYNPFVENVFEACDQFDESVELSEARFVADTARAEAGLEAARLGSCLITYHRFSGRIPGCYDLAHVELALGAHWVRVWVKRRERAEGYHVETDDGGVIACS